LSRRNSTNPLKRTNPDSGLIGLKGGGGPDYSLLRLSPRKAEFRRDYAIERKNNTKSKKNYFEKGDLFIKLMEYGLPVKIITQIPSGLLTMQANQGILSRSKNCASVEIGDYLYEGWEFESGRSSKITGQVIKVTQKQITVRLGTPYNYLSGHREFPFSANYARSKENFTDRGHILYQSPDSSKMKTQDIVQGLPKVEQLLEVRETKESLPIRNHVNVRLTKVFWLFRQCYPVKVAAQKSLTILAQFLVDEVQHIYRSQGVDVADKHLEIIVRSMSSRVEVDQSGYSPFSPGELLEIHSMDRFLKYEDFTYVPIILGMTKVGLTTQGFLSSTSFQQSKQQLIIAAVTQKVEFLQGFKARIMLGRKLPI
jgi:DNA-directed RNA polymerase subunit beta'